MLNPRLLVDTFTPQSPTVGYDGTGGQTISWADGTAFKGRLSTVKTEERLNADKTTVYATHKVYCQVMTIDETYRLKLDSRFFEIVGVVKPSNLDTGHLEILVKEIT
jgi:head-tail adaptor